MWKGRRERGGWHAAGTERVRSRAVPYTAGPFSPVRSRPSVPFSPVRPRAPQGPRRRVAAYGGVPESAQGDEMTSPVGIDPALPAGLDPERVWYVSYGSNMHLDRLARY